MQKSLYILLLLICFGFCSGQETLAWKQTSDSLYNETPYTIKSGNYFKNKNFKFNSQKLEIKNSVLFWGTNEDLEQNLPLFHKKIQVCFLQKKKINFFNLRSY